MSYKQGSLPGTPQHPRHLCSQAKPPRPGEVLIVFATPHDEEKGLS